MYSHLSNSRGGWNKRGGGTKVEAGINEEVGRNLRNQYTWSVDFCVEGDFFYQKPLNMYFQSKKGPIS